jgi:hypothetical protein
MTGILPPIYVLSLKIRNCAYSFQKSSYWPGRPMGTLLLCVTNNNNNNNNSVGSVRERTISTELPPVVGEVSASFCR